MSAVYKVLGQRYTKLETFSSFILHVVESLRHNILSQFHNSWKELQGYQQRFSQHFIINDFLATSLIIIKATTLKTQKMKPN